MEKAVCEGVGWLDFRWVARMCWDGQNDTSNANVGYVGEPRPQNPLLSSTTMTEPLIIDGFPPSCG